MTLIEVITNPPIAAALAGFSGAFLGYLKARSSKPHDLQREINKAVAELISGFETQFKTANATIERQNREIAALASRVEEQSDLLIQQAGEIRALDAHIATLTTKLAQAGVDAPDRPRRTRKAALT